MDIETKYGKDVSRADSLTAQFLFNFSQRISRRGFVAKLAKLGLIAGAVEAGLPVLPIDRRMPPAAADDLCYACNYCGLRGWPCEYTGCNGDYNRCPSTTYYGIGWYQCCYCGADKGSALFYYQDCCYKPGTSQRCPPLCHAATNKKCLNNPGCNGCGSNKYCCTLNQAVQSC